VSIAVAILVTVIGASSKNSDPCAALFPSDLRTAVAKQFPGYRLPRQTDNNADDIRYNREHGGVGCLGADRGDFDHDGRRDVAFLAVSGENVFLMVAFARPAGWQVEKVGQAGESTLRSRLYVEVTDPGRYDDLGLADEMEPGQVPTFTCDSQVIVTGMTESTGVAFCKGQGGWVHAWISD
jgi:hypothetical protein